MVKQVFMKVVIMTLFSLCLNYELKAQAVKEEEELLQLIKHFQQSIVEKDSVQFMGLFLHDSIPWIGISSAKSWAFHKERRPDINQLEKGSCGGFIRSVVNYPGRIEEKMFNISIQLDEVMATLTFDYSFWKDQLPANWGKESWVILKTNGQWKIAAVYYSGFNQAVEPTPSHLL